MAWMFAVGTNRSTPDFYLGVLGYGLGALGLVASFAALALHPWRSAGRARTLWLLAHLPALACVLALAFLWLALHIA
jgi:hypothetical protein